MINKRYNQFLPNLQRSEELMVQVDDISKEMDGLKNTIENEVSLCGLRKRGRKKKREAVSFSAGVFACRCSRTFTWQWPNMQS